MKKLYLILLAVAMVITVSCENKNSSADNPLTFKSPTMSVAQFQTAAIELTNAPSGAEIVYTSSNTQVATIGDDGILLAKNVGVTYISAFVKGQRESTVSAETLTVTVTDNRLTAIEISGASVMAVKDTIDFLVKLNPTGIVSNRTLEIVTTDSVGLKYASFTIVSAANRENPDTIRVAGLQYGKVEFFARQESGKDADDKKTYVSSNRIALEITGEIKSTDFKFALTPQQKREGRTSYNTRYTVGGTTPDPITKIDRTACDTILFDILPYNTTETQLKFAVSRPNVVTVEEISLKVKEDGKDVTKKGLKITPIVPKYSDYVDIKISTNGGYQLTTNTLWVYAKAESPKYVEITKVEFEKDTMLLSDWDVSQAAPSVKYTYKNNKFNPADTSYTYKNYVTYDWISDSKPVEGQPVAENIYIYRDSYLGGQVLLTAYFGTVGYGVAQLRVNVWNEAKTEVMVRDTCSVIVNMPIKSAVFKTEYQFIDAKYVISTLVNPLFNATFAWGASAIEAQLIFKEDDKAKAKVVETITLKRTDDVSSWIAKEQFTPIADGKKLSQYSVKYTFSVNQARYWVIADKITVFDPNAFAPKK